MAVESDALRMAVAFPGAIVERKGPNLALHWRGLAFRILKVKVGRDLDDDLVRIAAIVNAFPEAELIVPAFRSIQLAEGHETHRSAGLWPARADEYGADVRRRVALGAEVALPELLAAHADREIVRAAFGRLFEHADVLLTPAVPLAPPRIEDERSSPALRDAVLAYTAPQDLVGLPAYVLPSGMQLTGPPGSEPLLVAVAAMLE